MLIGGCLYATPFVFLSVCPSVQVTSTCTRKKGQEIWCVHLSALVTDYTLRRIHVSKIKVVLGGYPRCPDSHDLSECHHLYDLGRHLEYILALRPLLTAKYLISPIRLTVLTLTPKKNSVITP